MLVVTTSGHTVGRGLLWPTFISFKLFFFRQHLRLVEEEGEAGGAQHAEGSSEAWCSRGWERARSASARQVRERSGASKVIFLKIIKNLCFETRVGLSFSAIREAGDVQGWV